MEEEDYIQLQTLLVKLRVDSLKSLTELEDRLTNETIQSSRKERERKVTLIRSIDNIRRLMPLKTGETTITFLK